MKKIMQSVFALVVLLVIVTVFWQSYRFWWASAAPDAEAVEFRVEAGASLTTIAADLKASGLIKNAFWFKVYTRLDGASGSVQAGVFEVLPGMSYAEVIDVLIDADSDEVRITIPEGYTLKQIGEVVAAHFDVTEGEWALMTGMESPLEDHPFVVAAEKPENVDLEGYLFPDTYRFFADATAEDIATRMLEEMEVHVEEIDFTWTDEYDATSDTPKSLHGMLTLASIIEREVRSQDDMRTVAGIFYNRLEIGMPLQADSTVNYVTGRDDPSISFADTELESPYNTYKYAGLPPGAISNPGRSALSAVANPGQTDYFFFLTSEDGTVYYAETFEQHVENKNRYLR